MVRMDRDGRILRFPLTYMWGRWNRGFPSLLKLNENQDKIRVIPALNEISRAELLVRGDEEREHEKDRRAAVFVRSVKNIRMHTLLKHQQHRYNACGVDEKDAPRLQWLTRREK